MLIATCQKDQKYHFGGQSLTFTKLFSSKSVLTKLESAKLVFQAQDDRLCVETVKNELVERAESSYTVK